MTDVTEDRGQAGAELSVADEQLLRELTERARTGGLKLTGEGGLLGRLTKMVVEGALEGELDDHLGYARHDPEGRDGGNSRNGYRAKTVITDTGPVEISVPRDRDASFEPRIAAKRQRRLTGVDDMVISLSAKGLTHGEICAHLAEVYGAEVSKQTITAITDRVMEGLAEWQSRPLDPVHAGRADGGLRRAERPAGRGECRLGEDHRANLHRAPPAQFIQIRLEKGLGTDRERPQAGVHRRVRIRGARPVRRIQREMGEALPGYYTAVGERVGGIRAVPAVRPGNSKYS